jgi:hypothetical protein
MTRHFTLKPSQIENSGCRIRALRRQPVEPWTKINAYNTAQRLTSPTTGPLLARTHAMRWRLAPGYTLRSGDRLWCMGWKLPDSVSIRCTPVSFAATLATMRQFSVADKGHAATTRGLSNLQWASMGHYCHPGCPRMRWPAWAGAMLPDRPSGPATPAVFREQTAGAVC